MDFGMISISRVKRKKINNYNEFISKIEGRETCKLASFIHLFAYNEDNDWKFEESIPENNFCFTFHPFLWRLYFDYDDEINQGVQINNFLQVYPFLFNEKWSSEEQYKDYLILRNIYNNFTNNNFSITQEDFIKAYRLWPKIITESLERKKSQGCNQYHNLDYIPHCSLNEIAITDEELKILYNKSKNFYNILNKVEKCLFNLEESEILKLSIIAKEKDSDGYLPVVKFSNINKMIYNFHYSLVKEVKIKRKDAVDYIQNAEIELNTRNSIGFFEKDIDIENQNQEVKIDQEIPEKEMNKVKIRPIKTELNKMIFQLIKCYPQYDKFFIWDYLTKLIEEKQVYTNDKYYVFNFEPYPKKYRFKLIQIIRKGDEEVITWKTYNSKSSDGASLSRKRFCKSTFKELKERLNK